MTISEAGQVFSHLMTTARARRLTTREKTQLSYARQKLRTGRKAARTNPASKRRKTTARRNPAPRRASTGMIRMGKLVEIRYYRDHGRAKGFYKHPFKVRPDIYYRASDNSIFIKG